MTLDVGSLLFEERPGILDPQCTVIFKNDWVIASSMTLVPDKIPAEEFLAERRPCCIGVINRYSYSVKLCERNHRSELKFLPRNS